MNETVIKFKLRYCRVQMARYISGDLPAGARRRVARYISECEHCYREFIRHREFTQTLERNLPLIGRTDPATLDRVWARLSAGCRPSIATVGAIARLSRGRWREL